MQTDLSGDTQPGQAIDQKAQPEARQATAERSEPAVRAAEARPVPTKVKADAGAQKPQRTFKHRAGKAVSYVRGTWLGRNWYTITVLVFLVVLGLFVRSYFGVEPATENGFVLSGGSDSYYHQRAYLYGYETGNHLHFEDMLNYPMGTRNPRAPIYDWTIIIGGEALSPFFGGDAMESMWWVFIFSTAFWGAITVIPTYFLAKEAFGKKAGYIAAFLIAIMPGHIQRSVLTNADHDAISLFFIVTAFYFFLKALKNLKPDSHVDSWRDVKGAAASIKRMVGENKVAVLFALLSGFSFLAVALTWQGYAYMLVIVTAYYGIQILLNRFRNVSSLGVTMVYFIAVGTITLLAFPYYFLSIQIPSWDDTPTYMFLGAFAFGMALEITRKYPWLLVLTIFAVTAGGTVLALYLFWPSMYDTVIGAVASGAGYFVHNKQYETIAEAQAPDFSNLATSFGVVTFWLSLVGLAYAIYQLPKKLKSDYLFIVVWTATSIYMAVSAARFMFNAAPAFAVTAGWTVSIIIEKLDLRGALEQQRRTASGFNNDWDVFQTSFVVGLVIGISGIGAYLYMDSLAPLAIAAVAMLTLAYSVYAYGMRAKWFYQALGFLPLLITLVLYLAFYDGFEKAADHIAVPLLSAFGLALLVVQLRGAKLRTTAGVLFLAFMVVVPNVWAGVDAGIPYEVKADYDKTVYDVVPSAFSPTNYDEINGTTWYLGGFGYSLPLNTQYYPAAYDWLATQDANVLPAEERPAYLSWWDYGFEAVNEGQHPTVADNFLGGHQLAGNFIMAQNESNAISLLIARLFEADWMRNRNAIDWGNSDVDGYFSDDVIAVIESHGLDEAVLDNMIRNPGEYKELIWENPDIYSPRDSILQDANAQYLACMGYVSTSMNMDGVTALYHDLREATGWSIRYFAIDTRLFPFSGDNTGIFYAPAKLSDHRMSEPNQPYDFFEIKAVGEYGGEYSLDDVPDDVQIVDYKLQYNDMFFETMLYKCFVGYGGKDIGGTNADGIPGINGTLESEEPMQGWNLTHFRRVYRTAYYNPYDAKDVQNHTDAWQAMNYDDAVKLQKEITAGNATGIIDGSARSAMYQGVSMLKYYDGAIVSGNLALTDGTPVAGAHVTVYDEYGIPHHIVSTDSDGNYELLAPFGNVTVVASTGKLTLDTLVGTAVNSTSFYVRDDQAMREQVDRDGDGVWDYYITKNLVVEGTNLAGAVYADTDANQAYSGSDYYLPGAMVTLASDSGNGVRIEITGSEGEYNFTAIPPGSYQVNVSYNGYELVPQAAVEATTAGVTTKDFPLKTVTMSGYVVDANGAAVANASVGISDENGNIVDVAYGDQDGFYNSTLTGGRYFLRASKGEELWSQLRFYELSNIANATVNVTVQQSKPVSGKITLGGVPVPFARVEMYNLRLANLDATLVADGSGEFLDFVPFGEYIVYSTYTVRGNTYAMLDRLLVDSTQKDLEFEFIPAGKIHGFTKNSLGRTLVGAKMAFASGEVIYRTITNASGYYAAVLPIGTYSIHLDVSGIYEYSISSASVQAYSATRHDVSTQTGVLVNGLVYQDIFGNGTYNTSAPLAYSSVSFTDESGVSMPFYTDNDGWIHGIVSGTETYFVTVSSLGYALFVSEPMTGLQFSNIDTYLVTTGSIRISGTVFAQSEDLPVEGLVIYIESDKGQEAVVPIRDNGQYLVRLPPGNYIASMNSDLSGNGTWTEVYQFEMGTVRLDIGPGTKDTTIDFYAVKRVLVNVSATVDGAEVPATMYFDGPEGYVRQIAERGGEAFFLMPGEYRVMARYSQDENASISDVRMAYANYLVSTGANITINLTSANMISGKATYGRDAKAGLNVTLTDTLTGVVLVNVTDGTGGYAVDAIPGREYRLRVNQTLTEQSGTVTRYYRYSADETFTAVADGATVRNAQLARTMDNATVTGSLLGATGFGSQTIDFLAADDSAISASVRVGDSGEYSTSLAPGLYKVYALDSAEKKVAIGTANVTTEGFENLAIRMSPGFKFSGNIYSSGSSLVETNLSIQIGPASRLTVYSEDGYYETWLPAGEFNVSAERTVSEYGQSVLYRYNTSVNLESNLRYNIALSRQDKYGARVDWDSGQNVPVAPGGNRTYYFTVTNVGNLVDTFVLDAVDEAGWTFQLSEAEATLAPEESLSVSLHMTVAKDVKVEHPPITVTVQSKNNAVGAAVSKEMDVAIIQTHNISAVASAVAAAATEQGYSMAFSVTNNGNGNEDVDIVIGNMDELLAKGWAIDWSPSASLEAEVNGTKLLNVPIGQGAKVEIKFTLKRNASSVGQISSVEAQAYSRSDKSVFDTVSLPVRSGEVVQGSSMPSASGDTVTGSNPATGHIIDAVGIFAIVGVALLVYYVMRKRRWLS